MAKRITVLGTGYVGLVTSVGLADFGNTVTGVDLRSDIVDTLNSGTPTIYELGLQDYLSRNLEAGRLTFTTEAGPAIAQSDIVFLAVGTPPSEDGSADLSQIEQAAAQIAQHMDGFTVVVTKSTVPVGTNRRIATIIEQSRDGVVSGADYAVVSNPEFLREGKAVQDFFHPDRIVLGCESDRARSYLEDVYRALYLIQTPFVWCNLETAELIKYASNAFLATKITFINQMANLAEVAGADIHVIAKSMGMDGRISPKFLHPGPGYGGSCFPKDTKAVATTGRSLGVHMSLIEEVIAANDAQKGLVAQKLLHLLGDDVAGKTVAVLGLAFKAETDDVRESPAFAVVGALAAAGVAVRAYDPQAAENFRQSAEDPGPFGAGIDAATRKSIAKHVSYHDHEFVALDGADAAVIVTEWNAFRNLDLERTKAAMRGSLLFDTRNVLDPVKARDAGFTYVGVGR